MTADPESASLVHRVLRAPNPGTLEVTLPKEPGHVSIDSNLYKATTSPMKTLSID